MNLELDKKNDYRESDSRIWTERSWHFLEEQVLKYRIPALAVIAFSIGVINRDYILFPIAIALFGTCLKDK